jgi:hypothetical protein
MLPGVEFQQRRKRAAKLAQFFGVGYRDLFGEVLESIETGVQDDGYRGTLTPDQVQVSRIWLRIDRAQPDTSLLGSPCEVA